MEKGKLKKQILNLLEHDIETRNNDMVLTTRIWLKFYKDRLIQNTKDEQWYASMQNILYLPHQDAVKRIRAKIQNEEHKFLPTDPDVRKLRKISEEDWKHFLGYRGYK